MFWKVCFTGLAVATLALAQMGGGGGGDLGGGAMGGNMGGAGKETGGNMGQAPRPQKETKADMMIARLKLNKDQQGEFVTILTSTDKEALPVIQQVMQSRQQLALGLINGKTGADLDALTKAVQDAQFQMTGVEVKAFQRIVALLKPNQVAKAPEAFELMGDIFIPTTGGGGAGGRGPRGGGGDGGR